MTLRAKITEDLKTAMKAKKPSLVKTLRFIQAGLKNKEIELRPKSLTESDSMAVLKKLKAQVEESVEHYKRAGRAAQLEEEEFQLSVLKSYLPKPMSSEELQNLVNQAIEESAASSMKDMGKLMKLILSKAEGRVEAKALSNVVKESLSKL